MDSYEMVLDLASRKNLDMNIPNRTIGHAEKQFHKLLGRTEKRIQIVTGELLDDFYSSSAVAAPFRKAVEQGLKVQILFAKDMVEALQKPFAKSIIGYPNVEARQLPSAVSKEVSHMIIIDESAWRVELDETGIAKGKVEGVANFGNKKMASKFASHFDEWWEHSTSR